MTPPSSLSTIAAGVWVAVLCWAMAYLCFLVGGLYRARSVRQDWAPHCAVLAQGIAAAGASVVFLLAQQRAGGCEEAIIVTFLVGAVWALALVPVALGPRRS